MKRIIHHIRRQPEEVRRHILHVLLIVLVWFLLFSWVNPLGRSITNPNPQAKISNDLKPLSALKGNIIGGYQSITEPNQETEKTEE